MAMRDAVPIAMLVAACVAVAGCSAPARDERLRAAKSDAPLADRLAIADPRAGAAIFAQCAACHMIGEGAGDRDGPNLYHVLGRSIGHGSGRFGYTAALQAVGGAWTFAKLDAWLAGPQRFAPGTNMAFPGLPNGMDRADVIAFLNGQGSNLPMPPRPAR